MPAVTRLTQLARRAFRAIRRPRSLQLHTPNNRSQKGTEARRHVRAGSSSFTACHPSPSWRHLVLTTVMETASQQSLAIAGCECMRRHASRSACLDGALGGGGAQSAAADCRESLQRRHSRRRAERDRGRGTRVTRPAPRRWVLLLDRAMSAVDE